MRRDQREEGRLHSKEEEEDKETVEGGVAMAFERKNLVTK